MTYQSEDMIDGNSRDIRPEKRVAWRRLWKFPRTWREVRSLGWKFVLAFVLFYLIRDVLLYIVIPYLIYEGLISQ